MAKRPSKQSTVPDASSQPDRYVNVTIPVNAESYSGDVNWAYNYMQNPHGYISSVDPEWDDRVFWLGAGGLIFSNSVSVAATCKMSFLQQFANYKFKMAEEAPRCSLLWAIQMLTKDHTLKSSKIGIYHYIIPGNRVSGPGGIVTLNEFKIQHSAYEDIIWDVTYIRD